MEYILSVVLTIALSLCIIEILKRRNGVGKIKIMYRQSDMHNILKQLNLNESIAKIKSSQIQKRLEGDKIQVVAIDGKAYWVQDSVFYVAEIDGHDPDMATAKPVDTINMSKEDIDKMLFILDNLGGGKKDERGSAGNE